MIIRDSFKMIDLGSNSCFIIIFIFIYYFLLLQDCNVALSYISHNLFIYFILIFNFHYWILSTFHYLQQGESLGLSVALLFLLFIYLLFYLLFIIFYFYRIAVLQYHIYLIIYLFIYYFLFFTSTRLQCYNIIYIS